MIAGRVARFHPSDLIKARLAFLEAKEAVLKKAVSTPPRPAYYCSGCPHNRSTKVPDGSLALAGIGCHVMATAIYPEHNRTTTQMGGEGAAWIGQAAFSKLPHVFANLGDGTYFHSGYLAIRAAVAANVNITYKILYNDAVAMTGGQPIDGTLTVPMIARQMAAEGVERIALVTEDLTRYADRSQLPDARHAARPQGPGRRAAGAAGMQGRVGADLRPDLRRREAPPPQEEKNTRRRARGVFINEAVCEGCGDCGVQSNCTSHLPLETEFGRKRVIDQSSCNQDYSCVGGLLSELCDCRRRDSAEVARRVRTPPR